MILIADDDNSVRLSLSLLLRRAGHEVTAVASPDEALEVVRSTPLRLIIMDMNFTLAVSGEEGIELLRKCKIFQPETPVILITAWGSIPLAVEGMKAGASDFITKPWSNRELMRSVDTALSLSSDHKDSQGVSMDRCGIIGESQALKTVLERVERVAPTDASVLILGENGTGKEMIARAIHANSRRHNAPFVAVNLGGIPRTLFESEMFGHVKGSFTGAVADRKGRFAMADGGTIFLDEIGDLDHASQVKMLRVLQEHTYEPLGDSHQRHADVRVVCATNADLESMVAERTFREDLFYRINLITLRLPALRERRSDIPLLVRHFISDYATREHVAIPEVSSEAMTWLSARPWPGNIRELRNLVEQTMIVSGGPRLDVSDFASLVSERPLSQASRNGGGDDTTLDNLEKTAVKAALDSAGGNLTVAAAALGITRQSLYRRMEKYGLK